jgi:hypothetical protein
MEKKTTRKQTVIYSDELIDKIADKLSQDMSFAEIARKFAWAPTKGTMWKWATTVPYAKLRFKEAQTLDLELRKRDKIRELRNTDIDQLAQDVVARELPREVTSILLKAKIDNIRYQIDLEFRELEIELPKKYRKQVQQDLNVSSTARVSTLQGLLEKQEKLLEHPGLKELKKPN